MVPRRVIASLFAISMIFVPLIANGALLNSVSETLSLDLRPERPKPFDTVTLYIESYSVDLSSSEISWFVEGALQKRARGDKTFTFAVGPLGSASDVAVVVTTLDGVEFRKNMTIRPADMSLIWEAEGYTPPFYRGKARFTYQGSVRVAAVPEIIREDGTRVPSRDIIYTWKKDGKVVSDQSGYGQNVFKTEGGIPIRPVTISVEAATTDSLYVAESSITINPERPFVLLYENSPLYGVMTNNALTSSLKLASNEVVIAAVPYYFGTNKRTGGNLSYEWEVNAAPVRGFTSNLVLRKTGETAATTHVSLKVSNIERIFQFAGNETSVSIEPVSGSASFFNTN